MKTLCWKCQHAVPNCCNRGCSWSMFGEPVDGWKVVRQACVVYCPQFIEDEPRLQFNEEEEVLNDELLHA